MSAGSEPLIINDMETPSKRRKTQATSSTLGQMSSDDLVNNLHLFQGEQVDVLVEGEKFTLPKKLLSHSSTYFAAALNGSFQEGVENKIELSDFSASTFRLVVQWIVQGKVVIQPLPREKKTTNDGNGGAKTSEMAQQSISESAETWSEDIAYEEKNSVHLLDKHLDFLRLANYLDLHGDLDTVADNMKNVINYNKCCLHPRHIQTVLTFADPQRRTLKEITSVLASEYHLTLKRWSFSFDNLDLKREIENSDVFGAELLNALFEESGVECRGCTWKSGNDPWTCDTRDESSW